MHQDQLQSIVQQDGNAVPGVFDPIANRGIVNVPSVGKPHRIAVTEFEMNGTSERQHWIIENGSHTEGRRVGITERLRNAAHRKCRDVERSGRYAHKRQLCVYAGIQPLITNSKRIIGGGGKSKIEIDVPRHATVAVQRMNAQFGIKRDSRAKIDVERVGSDRVRGNIPERTTGNACTIDLHTGIAPSWIACWQEHTR